LIKTRAAKPKAAPKAEPTAKGRSKTAVKAQPRGAETEEIIIAPALSQVVGYLLRRSHNAFQGYWMAKFYRPETPITPVQGGMLVVIGSNPGLTQTELARIMNVEGPTLMQSIDRLEENGYLRRTPRIGDRRSNSLQLTPLGNKVLSAIQDFLPVRDADLLAVLSPKEIGELARLLTKIVTRAHLRLKELQEQAPAGRAPTPTRRRTAAK
jgi:DNA-binding MarR family transcriptional regulator